MPGSITSVFGEPDNFQAALSADGVLRYVVTRHGQFRARLTQVTLRDLCLSAGEEHLSRIAFVTVPADMLLVSLAIDRRAAPIWGGTEVRAGELIALGAGQRVHTRTDGPCRWGAIRLRANDLTQYGRALSGAGFVVPSAARWRPPRAALRQLRHFHQAAVRRVEARSEVFADTEAAHGLEQQLIHALVECLAAGLVEEETEAVRWRRSILARFEGLLEAEPLPGLAEISAALNVSRRMLRECCREHLGMDSRRYCHLRGMQLVHRALRSGNPGASSIAEVASRYGLRDLSRLAANYRVLYGELPSTTLRQGRSGDGGHFGRHKGSVKLT